MSIPIVKQNVSGPPLPVGTNISYAREIYTLQWRQFQCTSDGYVSYQDLYPFPPYENRGLFQPLLRLVLPDRVVNLGDWDDYVYDVESFQVANFDPQLFENAKVFHCGFICRSVKQNAYDNLLRSYIKIGTDVDRVFVITENVYPLGVFSILENVYVAGLGCTVQGSPYFYLHIGTYASASNMVTIPVNASACIVNGKYEVLSFGTASTVAKYHTDSVSFTDLHGYVYVLLNNETGVALELKVPYLTWKYVTFTIPAGGKIKQFANGFYIASNSAGEHFLYSINNNGTLIDQLDIGTCNIDNPLEILAVA